MFVRLSDSVDTSPHNVRSGSNFDLLSVSQLTYDQSVLFSIKTNTKKS